jgi:hypothetical protein
MLLYCIYIYIYIYIYRNNTNPIKPVLRFKPDERETNW